MDEYKIGVCFACREEKKVRHKNLYPNGSEGCELCIDCELEVVNFLRRLSTAACKEKKEEFKRKKVLAKVRPFRSPCGF